MPSEIVYKPIEKVKPIYTGGTLTPPKFMPTYYEWLKNLGQQIIINSGVPIGGFRIIYTVTLNHKFFITNVWLSVSCTDGGHNVGYFTFTPNDADQSLCSVSTYGISNNSNAVNFSIPLKFNEHVVFKIQSTVATNKLTGGFSGFLMKKINIPNF